uniref:Uncharacterized protein n=1 Tax=Siphoviridae sp. ctq8D8 TaxID=2827944 RepID=A0A8S5SMM1_9CAUD|nr:MAG TPA: hypothetical protein [Siphoviridae sp. ctq8D8]
MGFNRAITAKGAKPSEPAAAIQRRMSAARPGELTRGAEIPSQLGGFASTRRPGRTGPVGESHPQDKSTSATRLARPGQLDSANHHHRRRERPCVFPVAPGS